MKLSIQEDKEALPPEDHAAMDRAIERLNSSKQAWANLPVSRKIAYLEKMRVNTARVAERWVAAAVRAKAIPGDSPLVGEEWLSGPWAVLFALNRYISSLAAIAERGYPKIKKSRVHTRPDGQVVVDVFPESGYDRLLFSGIKGQVWMQPDVTPETLQDTLAVWYRTPSPPGKVALVLGAGNIASIAPLDVLYKLLAEGQVCLLKMNPINEYLGPLLEEAFGDLVKDGFVRLVHGGADIGAYLCDHAGIDEIHITGSAATHDAIVFGAGEAGAANKRAGRILNPRRITSELGNVSPTIIVPGPWTKSDLLFQAEHILTQKMHNGGFNCVAAQVLVVSEKWSQTEDLWHAVRKIAENTLPRAAYYPGADQRRAAALSAHPDAEILDRHAHTGAPRVVVHAIPYDHVDDICFKNEVFGSLLAETRLPGNGPADFLRKAVAFCNETLSGTLGANILIHPRTMRAIGPVLDQALSDLHYGCIAVNAWTGVGFLLTPLTWGAFPGHGISDIQSGRGVVHNSCFFDRAQKSVVQGPFHPFPRSYMHAMFTMLPRPPWFITSKTADVLGRQLVHFEANPGMAKLPAIFYSALRG